MNKNLESNLRFIQDFQTAKILKFCSPLSKDRKAKKMEKRDCQTSKPFSVIHKNINELLG